MENNVILENYQRLKELKINHIKNFHDLGKKFIFYFTIDKWDKIKIELSKYPEYKELYDRMEKQVNDTIEYNNNNKRKHKTIDMEIKIDDDNKIDISASWEINGSKIRRKYKV